MTQGQARACELRTPALAGPGPKNLGHGPRRPRGAPPPASRRPSGRPVARRAPRTRSAPVPRTGGDARSVCARLATEVTARAGRWPTPSPPRGERRPRRARPLRPFRRRPQASSRRCRPTGRWSRAGRAPTRDRRGAPHGEPATARRRPAPKRLGRPPRGPRRRSAAGGSATSAAGGSRRRRGSPDTPPVEGGGCRRSPPARRPPRSRLAGAPLGLPRRPLRTGPCQSTGGAACRASVLRPQAPFMTMIGSSVASRMRRSIG